MVNRGPYLRPGPVFSPANPAGGRKALRRSRRWLRPGLRVLLVAGALVTTAAVAQAGWDFVHSDQAFALRRLQVVGVATHDPGELRASLEGLRGQNLVSLGPEAVSDRLAAFGWVEGFLCRKHLPDTLIVEIRERRELCTLAKEGQTFGVDGSGNAWPSPPKRGASFSLEPGSDPRDPVLQTAAAEILRAGWAAEIASLGRGPEGALVLRTNDGWTLLVSEGDLPGEWEKYCRAKAWASANLPDRKTVDLRWTGRAVFAAPPPAAGGETDG